MFESKAAMFLYAVSPVHMGAGTAIGVIDNPIQRERHTGYPMIAGSGLKGALRHEANALWEKQGDLVKKVFGPDPGENASDHAGALSIADAALVLFPVRSLRGSYVYATSPTALGRTQRLLVLAGAGDAGTWRIPAVEDDHCARADKGTEKLVLESYEFESSPTGELAEIASEIAGACLPEGGANQYFREKIKQCMVVLSDERFGYFVRNATVVEPHVRIDDDTGTAQDGGLFYTENLPPESLLVSLAMASGERGARTENGGGTPLPAEAVLDSLVRGRDGAPGFDGRMIQVGGDATSGRGQVIIRFSKGKA